MKYYPLVSIITVSYNSAKTIEQTILSVITQDYPNIEYIIIDGKSSDETVNIIKRYSSKISYWSSEPDNGIYDAMNKGINKANGEIIGIVNSDDWYENNIISKIVNYYSKSNPKILYGILEKHNNNNSSVIFKPHRPLNQFWMGNVISHPTVFVPKCFYEKFGQFNTKYRVAADYELLVRMYQNNIKFEYIPYTITHMRTGGESDKNAILGYKEAYRIAIAANFPLYKVIYAYYRKIIALYLKRLFQ